MAMQVELVSPERILFSGEAEMVVARTTDGEIAFLTGHAPFIGALVEGVVTIRTSEGQDELAAVHGGFVEVSDNRVTILEAGRATLELLDPTHAAFVDEVEVGRRVAGHIRLAFEVDDSESATALLEAAGAVVVAPPTRTPWQSLNSRLEGPAGLQLTLFSERPESG